MKNLLWSLVREEEGASMVEYGLLVALIAVVAITVLTTLGGGISQLFQEVADEMPDPPA